MESDMAVKILFYALTKTHGGIESFIYNYYVNMNNVHIDFIGMDEKVAYEEEMEKMGSVIYHMPPKKENRKEFYNRLEQVFRENQYDVAWFNDNNLCDIHFLKLAKKYNVPVRICHSHNSTLNSGKLHYMVHKLNSRSIDKYANNLWACSGIAAEWAYGKDYNNRAVRVIINAIDIEQYRYKEAVRKSVREKLQLDDKFIIGNVGRISEVKNQMFLLEIFKEVLKRKSNSVLLLVGRGELYEQVSDRIKELELSDSVYMLGPRSDVSELLQAFDVFAFPSLYEGLPFAIIEAQAAGTPCVVSEAVDKSAFITSQIETVRLEQGAAAWAEAIIRQRDYDRTGESNRAVSGEYNIKIAAKELEKWFGDSIGAVR